MILYRGILRLLDQRMICASNPSALELSVNAKMCDPCPIFRMVMLMVTADAKNSRRFNVSFPCYAAGIIHCHARPFFLYLPMPYSQASDNIVTDGLTKTMLLIENPLVVTCCSNFIHGWRSWRCHSWSFYGPHFPPSLVNGVSDLRSIVLAG